MRSSILQSSHVIAVLINKVQFFINTFPRLMESGCLIFLNVVIMICLLNIIASFFFNNFVSFIVEHSLLSYPFDSIAIFVCLLFLRNCLSIFMLSSRILEVTLGINFSIRAHCGTTHKSLTDIRSLFAFPVSLLMH